MRRTGRHASPITILLALALAIPTTGGVALAQTAGDSVAQVYEDAAVIRRVTEVGKKDLPRDLLERIVEEDIDLLRGKRSDGTYEFAHYESDEAGRITEGFTVGSEGKISHAAVKGAFVFRLVIDSPSRRYLIRRNRRVFIDRVELEMTPVEGPTQYETRTVGAWVDPGNTKSIDFPEVMRNARATVYAKTEEKAGPASMEIVLLKARVADNFDSPYFGAVENAKLMLQNLKRGDPSNLITLSNMLRSSLEAKLQTAETIEPSPQPAVSLPPEPVVATPAQPSLQSTPAVEIYLELQRIEDLLTGAESERREGMDQLHQLIRRLRSER